MKKVGSSWRKEDKKQWLEKNWGCTDREREREREVVVRYDNTPTDISIIYLADVVRIFARREYIL